MDPAPFVLRIEDFDGEQKRLSPIWSLTKGSRTAECSAWSHPLGVELRLVVGEDLLQSQVCRGAGEIAELQERWRGAMGEKGWT